MAIIKGIRNVYLLFFIGKFYELPYTTKNAMQGYTKMHKIIDTL